MPPVDGADNNDESRTLSIGPKRNHSLSQPDRSSGQSTPRKRRKKRRPLQQDIHDFVPVGGTFSPVEVMEQPHIEDSDEQEASGGVVNPPPPPPNQTSQNQDDLNSRRADPQDNNKKTSLGRNRLATGFSNPKRSQNEVSDFDPFARANSLVHESTGESADDAIEISDDSDLESGSEGGMVINVESQGKPEHNRQEISDSEAEDGEIEYSPESVEPQNLSPLPSAYQNDVAHKQLQVESEIPAGTAKDRTESKDQSRPKLQLKDLNPDDVESQIKYALFHLDRDQIDLNRVVTCLACLKEGHLDRACPEYDCIHCREKSKHSSQRCPTIRRCLRCRERGHDQASCKSKLKDNSVPCDYCGSLGHLEDGCSLRFFPTPPAEDDSQINLWISCANCASKAHLIGDCPEITNCRNNACWSLKSVDPRKITNMSLETGTRRLEKEAEQRGTRPEGLQIKGRANNHQRGGPARFSSIADDDEDQFIRPPVRQRETPRGANNIRIGKAGPNGDRELSSPRGRDPPRYDRYDAPSDNHRYNPQGRGDWYATDSFGNRRRSRSPESDYHMDSYRPDSSSRYQNGQSSRQRNQQRRRSNSPPSVDSYRPHADDTRGRVSNEYRTRDHLPNRPSSPKPPLPREPLPARPPSPGSGSSWHPRQDQNYRRPPSPPSTGGVPLPTRQGSSPWLNEKVKQNPAAIAQPKKQTQNGAKPTPNAQNAQGGNGNGQTSGGSRKRKSKPKRKSMNA